MAKKSPASQKIYPLLLIDRIKNPNRMWATPVLGGLAKIILLIPVFIELWFLIIFSLFVNIINSFNVFINGRYWKYAFDLNFGIMKLATKTGFFFTGLTDKYPGFNFEIEDKFKLELQYPQSPNRFFATPVLGGLARIILLIPYLIYTQLISHGARIGVLVSFAPVFVKGTYPESTYELTRDAARLTLTEMIYIVGISDIYPSFNISKNHLKVKIALIILGLIFNISWAKTNNDYPYKYDNYDFRPVQEIQKQYEGSDNPII